jgi:phospholipid-transporting ATPase
MIALTLFIQFLLASIGAYFGASWIVGDGSKASYVFSTQSNKEFNDYLVSQIGTWILIFTNFVPISLMVSLEMVKFWQAMFMATDVTMYDDEQDMPMRG